MSNKFIDLVISGCDFSGTSTQIEGLIKYLKSSGKRVRDIRGTEEDAMFHAEIMSKYNHSHASLDELMNDKNVPQTILSQIISNMGKTLRMNHLKVSSMVQNEITEYINPDSADVWIMEEPTHRGSGQTVRRFELYRSQFGDKMNPISAALAHQAYRSEEFFRFRNPIRKAGKNVIRSRSEESACYQIQDKEHLPEGISREQYLSLPGHQVAFGNPPTNIFVVTGPSDWKQADYIKLRKERVDGRILDDHEKAVGYQILVNNRYATDWLEKLYEEGCGMYGSRVPEITRFDIYHSKEKIIQEMIQKLESIIS